MRKLLIALPLTCLPGPALALPDAAQLCDHAADRAARKTGVPLDILRAIARVESGRNTGQGFAPWPWSINIGGDGTFFDSASDAVERAEMALTGAAENFDVGCFQLNYRWHGGAFADLPTMFDPEANALYAANFLLTLYQSSGSWAQAIGAYHSQTEGLAQIYLAKVDGLLGGGLATAADAQPAAQQDFVRVNSFPLLLAGGVGQGGSIVPRTASRGSLFAAGN